MLIEDFEKFSEEQGLKRDEKRSIFSRQTLGILIDDEDPINVEVEDDTQTGIMDDLNCLVGDIVSIDDNEDDDLLADTPPAEDK